MFLMSPHDELMGCLWTFLLKRSRANFLGALEWFLCLSSLWVLLKSIKMAQGSLATLLVEQASWLSNAPDYNEGQIIVKHFPEEDTLRQLLRCTYLELHKLHNCAQYTQFIFDGLSKNMSVSFNRLLHAPLLCANALTHIHTERAYYHPKDGDICKIKALFSCGSSLILGIFPLYQWPCALWL